MVDKGNGYENAIDEMPLKESWKIKTGENSQASIVFYESDVAMLEPNTEIVISELKEDSIKTETKSGEAMHTVAKITGTRSYEARTPSAVATVRGTMFTLSEVDKDALLYEGTLDLESVNENVLLNPNQKSLFSEMKASDFTPEDKEKFKNKKQRLILKYKKMRLREMNKKPFTVKMVKKMFHADDDKITNWLNEADQGKRDLDKAESMIPFKTKSISKVKKMTEKIIALNKDDINSVA